MTQIIWLGKFVVKMVEEDLTCLLAPPTIGATPIEGSILIHRQHPQLILLKQLNSCNSTTQLIYCTLCYYHANY